MFNERIGFHLTMVCEVIDVFRIPRNQSYNRKKNLRRQLKVCRLRKKILNKQFSMIIFCQLLTTRKINTFSP